MNQTILVTFNFFNFDVLGMTLFVHNFHFLYILVIIVRIGEKAFNLRFISYVTIKLLLLIPIQDTLLFPSLSLNSSILYYWLKVALLTFVGQVTSLKGLNIGRNPLKFPSQDILSQGVAAILKYLRTMLFSKSNGSFKPGNCIGSGGWFLKM